uniref:SHSP domain-containing protein n=1 Tax=Glossina brevipalpis TaxID=37001 RepID=A0A1A9W4D2_9MUSC
MSIVPLKYRHLYREFDRPRYYPPYDFHWYPYLWDDPRIWWPATSLLKPMDELVIRRVRNQLIRSSLLDWAYPMCWDNYYSGESVHINENGFRVDIDVSNYSPSEIEVKTDDNYIVVDGKHTKRTTGGHYMVERHFTRKYLLPRGFNPDDVISDLSTDGILTIKALAPTSFQQINKQSQRTVPILETGRPRPALPWKLQIYI